MAYYARSLDSKCQGTGCVIMLRRAWRALRLEVQYVRRAFAQGPRRDFITGRAHDVYGLNKRFLEWEERQEAKKEGEALAGADDEATGVGVGRQLPQEPVRRAEAKVGRNDPCPCGSGKKYKRCHGTGE